MEVNLHQNQKHMSSLHLALMVFGLINMVIPSTSTKSRTARKSYYMFKLSLYPVFVSLHLPLGQ